MLARLAVIVTVLASPVGAAGEPPRLRVDHPQLARTIASGLQRSQAFRHIAEHLEASDVVVYAQFGRCPGGVEACLEFVTAAAPFLYVRATIEPFKKPECEIVGLLAHELQHALELSGKGVTTRAQFGEFYEKHGRRWSAGYETDEAAAAGSRAERECRAR